jgi:hypothetical protein
MLRYQWTIVLGCKEIRDLSDAPGGHLVYFIMQLKSTEIAESIEMTVCITIRC